MSKGVRVRAGDVVMPAAILAVSASVVVQAFQFSGGAGYSAVGPGVFPIIVGSVGILCGAVLLVQALLPLLGKERGDAPGASSDVDGSPVVWSRVMVLATVLVGYALLLTPVGFWQLTGAVYACAARIFGSKAWVRNLVIGYVLALVTYFLFDRFLGVSLPDGYIRIAG